MSGTEPLANKTPETNGSDGDPQTNETQELDQRSQFIIKALGNRSVVLVGLMGAGKTTVGRRLADRLGIPFVDADAEIEKAAGLTISEIFEQFGEQHFRDGERRVIARLLNDGPQVLATGGGAFMDDATRAAAREKGISLWLYAGLDVLMKRVAKRSHRPLLQEDDPRGVMERLIDQRYPVYAEADIRVESEEGPHERVVDRALEALELHYKEQQK